MKTSTVTHPVRHYLEQMARLRRRSFHARRNQRCRSLEELVLRHGAIMLPADQSTYLSIDFGRQGECFRNAALLAIGDEHLIYCEGYAMGIIPVSHAWVLDASALVVIDNTWGGMGEHYFGLPIKTRYLRERLCRQKAYGLLDQPGKWPLLHDPPKEWSHPVLRKLRNTRHASKS